MPPDPRIANGWVEDFIAKDRDCIFLNAPAASLAVGQSVAPCENLTGKFVAPKLSRIHNGLILRHFDHGTLLARPKSSACRVSAEALTWRAMHFPDGPRIMADEGSAGVTNSSAVLKETYETRTE
jgi:hypothetical protein